MDRQAGAPMDRWAFAQKLWRKGWVALHEQPFKVKEQLVERSQFLLASTLMARRARRDSRLTFGENVRLQSGECVRLVGPHARISIGDHALIYKGGEIVAREHGTIDIGRYCVFGQVSIYAKSSVEIGDYALFSWGVHLQDHTPHPIDASMRRAEVQNICEEFVPRLTNAPPTFLSGITHPPPQPIRIGDDVWLGANVTVLQGVTIGRGCVVGTGSVVTRDLPPFTVAAGVPAKVIRHIDIDEKPPTSIQEVGENL